MTSDDPKVPDGSPADIERQIVHTRIEIDTTLQALERKLVAQRLVEKGFDMVKDTFGGSEGWNRGMDSLRNNPVPLALIGIGAAWLIATNTGVADRIAHDERVNTAKRRVTDFASDMGNRAGDLASSVAERVGLGGNGADRPLGETGNQVVDQSGNGRSNTWMHQATQGALRSARDTGSAVLDRAGDFAGQRAGRLAETAMDAFERNPLVIGAIGVMAGALIASLLPSTRVEDEWMGGTRDELWHKAEEAGQEAVAKLRDVAGRAAEAAADAAADAAKGGGTTSAS